MTTHKKKERDIGEGSFSTKYGPLKRRGHFI